MESAFQESAWKHSWNHVKLIKGIINGQLDIKYGQFTEEDYDTIRKTNEAEKQEGLMKFFFRWGEERSLTAYFFDYAILYKKNTIKKWPKCCIFHFFKTGDFGITWNYRGINHTAIFAKVYIHLLLNCIRLNDEKMFWKKQNSL